MLESLKRFHNVKSFREFFTLLTWQDIEKVAAIPLFLFLVSPFIFFWHVTINNGWSFHMTISTIQLITFVLGATVLLCTFVKQRIEQFSLRSIAGDRMPQLLFLAMALLILISTLVNGFTSLALHGDSYRGESVFSFWCYILCYYGCASVIRSEIVKKFLCHALLFSSIFLAVVVLLDLLGLISIWHFHHRYPDYVFAINAVFINPNHYAYYLAVCVMLSFGLFLFEKKRMLCGIYLASLVLNTVVLVLNSSRGGYLGVLAGICTAIILIYKKGLASRRRFWIAVAVFTAASGIGFFFIPENFERFIRLFNDTFHILRRDKDADNAGSGRWKLWRYTIEYIAQKPLLGWGTEGVADMLNQECEIDRTHCEYLQYAAFYGIPTALVYITALVSIFRKAWKQVKELPPVSIAALLTGAAYLISAAFGNTMFYTAPYLFIMLGLGFQSSLPDRASAQK